MLPFEACSPVGFGAPTLHTNFMAWYSTHGHNTVRRSVDIQVVFEGNFTENEQNGAYDAALLWMTYIHVVNAVTVTFYQTTCPTLNTIYYTTDYATFAVCQTFNGAPMDIEQYFALTLVAIGMHLGYTSALVKYSTDNWYHGKYGSKFNPDQIPLPIAIPNVFARCLDQDATLTSTVIGIIADGAEGQPLTCINDDDCKWIGDYYGCLTDAGIPPICVRDSTRRINPPNDAIILPLIVVSFMVIIILVIVRNKPDYGTMLNKR